jgi:hypothetical protein
VGKTSSKIAVIAALTTLYPTFAAPQQPGGAGATPAANPGGVQLDFGVSTGLILDDNFKLSTGGGTGLSKISDTKLSFGLSNITAVDQLTFRSSGVIRFADIPGRSIAGFESPDAQLNYMRDGKNSRLSLDARYRKADREFLDPFKVEQEEQNTNAQIGGGGTQTWQNYGASYTVGLQSPISFSVTARHSEIDYSNTTATTLYDSRTDSLRTSTGFRISPVTQLTLNLGGSHYVANDAVGTDRKTQDLSLGLQQDINPVLALNASLGWSQIDTDYSLPVPSSKTRDGAVGTVTLTQTLANGTVWGSATSSLSVNGSRQSLSFGRDWTLPLGTLSLSAGTTRGANGDNAFIGSAVYTRQLQASDFSISMSRSASTNSASEDVLSTRVAASYGYQINNLSRIDLSANYGVTDNTTTGVKVERTTLRGAYTRQLTADWNVVGGVQFRTYDETAVGDATSNQAFVTLDRNFTFRP